MSVKIKLFAGMVAALIFTGILSVALVAHAEEIKTKAYYEMLSQNEETYVNSVRRYLADNGFKNAGINLTKTFDGDVVDEYKLVINHHSFEYASADKLDLMEETFAYGDGFYLDGDVRIEFSF